MTVLVANTFSWVGLTIIANWFRKLHAEMKRRQGIRETITELSKLTDYELNDIGMSRGEILYVAHSSFPRKIKPMIDQENVNLKGWV